VLRSAAGAKLGFFLTSLDNNGRTKNQPTQTVEIAEGDGEFELSMGVKGRGALHVSFYPLGSGSGFGGIYFGTPQQMERVANIFTEH
jgi:hypothetical protein